MEIIVMKIRNILLVCGCMCLTACGGKGPIPQLAEVAPPTVLVSDVDGALPCWNLKNDYSENFFEEAVDSMYFVLLQTTDTSMLGVIDQVQKIGDKLVVVDAFKAQKILVFDMNGKFLYPIGTKGKGPGEYTSLNHVFITSETVSVLDWLTWKYIRYDLEGNILYEHKFQKNPPETLVQVDEHVFVGSHAGYYPDSPYQLTWINDKDSVLNTALPFQDPHGEPAGALQYALDGSLLYYHNFCDTIYQVTKSEIVPKWCLGLYGLGEVEDFRERASELDNNGYNKMLYRKGEKIVNMFSLLEGSSYWFVEYQNASFVYLSVVDKVKYRSRNYIRTDMPRKKCYVPFVFRNMSDDWLCTSISDQFYAVLDESMREEFFSKVKSEKDREMLRNYDIENQNPIICLFHLK